MALSVKNQKFIDGLKALGVDTTSIEVKLDGDNNASRFVESQLLTNEEFNLFKEKTEQEKTEIINAARELINAKALSESRSEQVANMAALRVAELSEALEELGLSEEQIDNINPDTIKTLTTTSNNTKDNKDNKGVEMTKEEIEALANNSTLRGVGASAAFSSQLTRQVLRFKTLYNRDMTDAEFDDLSNKAWEGVNKDIAVSKTANELFKFDEKQVELETSNREAEKKQIAEEAVATFKRENPNYTYNQNSESRPDYKGSVLSMIGGDKNSRRSPTNNNPSNTNNNDDKVDKDNPNPDETNNNNRSNDSSLEAGTSTKNRNVIRTKGFKVGEMPFEVREERGQHGRLTEVMTHVEQEGINLYSDL